MPIHELKEQIARLPEQPGVYLYFNAEGDTIYVGKARALRDRVRNYLGGSGSDAKRDALLEEIHALAPDTKVIVLTGQNDRANALKAISLGAHDFCTKPFEPERLARKLEELLHTPPDMLRKKREAELQKAELLDRLESAFNRPRPVRY